MEKGGNIMVNNWVEKFAGVWKRFKYTANNLDVKILEEDKLSLWEDLFVGKVLPHLEGEGCLVIAVAGGTNTGKSTIINVLMGKEISAVDYNAAATKRPVLIASKKRVEQCLNNRMFLKFEARRMENKEDAISDDIPRNILLVKAEDLPDTYLYMDTPDIDSIAKEHWEIAEDIVSAGDVIIAVNNDTKYKDEAVIKFFRRALEEGKLIIPLMNKVEMDNPQAQQIADEQIKDFMKEVGLNGDSPRFYFPRFGYGKNVLGNPIPSLQPDFPELKEYIQSLDVQKLKSEIMQKTIEKFRQEFQNWYQDVFIKQLNKLSVAIKNIEYQLREVIIDKEFIPFGGVELDKLLKEEIKNQLGKIKYYIVYTTSIFQSKVNVEIDEIKIQETHNRMIEKCCEKILDYILENKFITGNEVVDKVIGKKLHELSDNRENLYRRVETKLEPYLSVNPEWYKKEIKEMVSSLINSPDMKGISGRRILAVILFGAGTLTWFVGLPWVGPWLEIITGGGMLTTSAFLERQGVKEFNEKRRKIVEKWTEEKRDKLNQIIKEEILQYVLKDIYEYIQCSEHFLEELQNENLCEVLGIEDVKKLPAVEETKQEALIDVTSTNNE